MRSCTYLILCLLWFSCGQREETENRSFEEDEATQNVEVSNPTSVSEIKQAYAATITKLESGALDSVSLKYDCYNERSGTITYFTDDGKLSMITHSYNEYDHYSATDQYFISDSNLFFIHLKGISWSFVSEKNAAEGATQDNFTEQRMYIVDNSPILCLEKKYTTRSDRPNEVDGESVSNKEVECQSIQAISKDLDRLIAFKNNPNKDCLEK